MICSKCGAQIPDNSRFCIMCGNRIEQQYPPYQPADATRQQPYQPIGQPAQPAAQDTSVNIFGVKSISDRHYSLEDIARQQEENKNEIGLASAPPPPKKKKKKKKTPPLVSSLPDNSETSEGTSTTPAPSENKTPEAPERPWYHDLKKKAPDISQDMPAQEAIDAPQDMPAQEAPDAPPDKPAQEATDATQDMPAQEATDVPQDMPAQEAPDVPQDMPAQEATDAPQDMPAQAAPDITQDMPAQEAPDARTETVIGQEASRRTEPAGPVFKYTITSPPVPTGLQRQTALRLFGGTTGADIRALESDFLKRKNSGNHR